MSGEDAVRRAREEFGDLEFTATTAVATTRLPSERLA